MRGERLVAHRVIVTGRDIEGCGSSSASEIYLSCRGWVDIRGNQTGAVEAAEADDVANERRSPKAVVYRGLEEVLGLRDPYWTWDRLEEGL